MKTLFEQNGGTYTKVNLKVFQMCLHLFLSLTEKKN